MWIRVVLSALGVTLLLSASLSAQAPAQAANLEVHKELHQAHSLLLHANHDYAGHRAKAAEFVQLALKTLGHHHNHPAANPANTKSTVKPATPPEAQGTSDEQLKLARGILKSAEQLLATSTDAKHQHALTDVAKAIEEIDAALKVR